MNLRAPPRAPPRAAQSNASVISNPFGGPMNNDTSTDEGHALFQLPASGEDQDNIFTSDNPTHSGIQFGDEDAANEFVADPIPQANHE